MAASESSLEFTPLRPLDDFALDGARFQIPPYKDLDKWNNRIISNLLYYQTNYFIMILVVFLLVGLIHPGEVLYGSLAIAIAVGVFAYATTNIPQAIEFKKAHPVVSLAIILVTGYLLVLLLSSVIVFLFGVCLPLLLMFLHASTRLRNLKNKLGNKLEAAGFVSTPMGVILRNVGIDVELIRL